MNAFRFFAFVLFLSLFNTVTYNQPIIINEIFNSSQSTDEWIELLLVEDNVDLRSWMISDFTNQGNQGVTLSFSNNNLWSGLLKGTIIVIGQSAAFTEDTEPGDGLLMIKGTNPTYFSGTVFTIGGASEAVHIKNGSGVHIFGVSWGSANASNIPQPKVHFAGSSTSNTSTAFKGDAINQLTDTLNWSRNTSATRGVGNTTANSAWINSMRSRPEGSGSASIKPNILDGNIDTMFVVTFHRDTGYTINNLRIIVPPEFQWSKDTTDVDYTNMTTLESVLGDTIYFTEATLHADSTTISIQSVTTPLYTGYYKFKVQTGFNGSYGDVSPIPVVTIYGASVPIAETKINDANGVALRIGDLVTVRGVITVANEFGSPSFIQDNSAGMSIYGTIFSSSVNIGDEVTVSGRVTQFNGLNQIEYPTTPSILSSGNIVEPLLCTPSQLNFDGIGGVENYEGLLVRLNGVTVTTLNGSPVSTWTANTNYRLTGSSPSDTVQLRIDNNTNIVGMVAPAGPFDVIGVLGQYKTISPFIGGYQLMPRTTSDILSKGPIISQFPEEVDLAPTSLAITWKTLDSGTSHIRYGKTPSYEIGTINLQDMVTTHNVSITDLTPATIYNMQAFSVSNAETSFASNLIVSTASSSLTTGQINVYFNKSVNTSIATVEQALGNYNLTNKLIERINNSKHSIDAAIYNMSASVGATIANALVNAKNRGIKVRIINEKASDGNAPFNTLRSNGIPVISDLYGANDGTGLQHNKFFVIDYRGGAPDSVWLWTGSWNPTDPGTNDDRQNVIEIQDVALAGAFTEEFEEMWGSKTETPNSANSRFGARKLNNTPHKFVVGGKNIECYFSPSDRTTYQIGKTLGKAQSSINTAILTFTRKELADSIINKKKAGRKTRVVMDNNSDAGNQYSYLQSNAVDVLLKVGSGMLHHKYAIVDAEPTGRGTYVITGSHNWSSSAETRNDENTLIIQDDRVSNLYLQEFLARYLEAGGTDTVIVGVEQVDNEIPAAYSLSQNFPNPFNPTTKFEFRIVNFGLVSIKVYDILGREVTMLVNELKQPGTYEVSWDASNLASGVYYYKIQVKDPSSGSGHSFVDVKKMLFLR